MLKSNEPGTPFCEAPTSSTTIGAGKAACSARALASVAALALSFAAGISHAQAVDTVPRPRLGAEVLGSTLGGLLGLGLSVGAFKLAYDAGMRQPDTEDRELSAAGSGLVTASLTGAVTLPMFAAVGACFPGRILCGKRELGWSLLGGHAGSLLGAGLGVGLGFGLEKGLGSQAGARWLAVPALTLIGTVVGAVGAKEWSHSRQAARRYTGVATLRPSLALDRDGQGGVLTVDGRF